MRSEEGDEELVGAGLLQLPSLIFAGKFIYRRFCYYLSGAERFFLSCWVLPHKQEGWPAVERSRPELISRW